MRPAEYRCSAAWRRGVAQRKPRDKAFCGVDERMHGDRRHERTGHQHHEREEAADEANGERALRALIRMCRRKHDD